MGAETREVAEEKANVGLVFHDQQASVKSKTHLLFCIQAEVTQNAELGVARGSDFCPRLVLYIFGIASRIFELHYATKYVDGLLSQTTARPICLCFDARTDIVVIELRFHRN